VCLTCVIQKPHYSAAGVAEGDVVDLALVRLSAAIDVEEIIFRCKLFNQGLWDLIKGPQPLNSASGCHVAFQSPQISLCGAVLKFSMKEAWISQSTVLLFIGSGVEAPCHFWLEKKASTVEDGRCKAREVGPDADGAVVGWLPEPGRHSTRSNKFSLVSSL